MPITFDAPGLNRKVRSALMPAVIKATESVRTEAIRSILSGLKTGRIYGAHQASAPGEPPASDTGALAGSIETSYDAASLTGKVTVRSAYGAFLEYGTNKIQPRPFLRPALENNKAAIESLFAEALRKALEGP